MFSNRREAETRFRMSEFNRFYGLLRDIRAEAQNLLSISETVRQAGQGANAATRLAEMQAQLKKFETISAANQQQIKDLLVKTKTLLDEKEELHDFFGDEVTQIDNFLERALNSWPQPNAAADEILLKLDEYQKWLGEIVWHCALVTIPKRVQAHLAQLRVGNALNFEAEFHDELPNEKQRTNLLQFLHDHPLEIGGVVDVERGVIIKASAKAEDRRKSFWRLLALIVIGGVITGLIPLVATLLPDSSAIKISPKLLVIEYLAVMLGGFAHVCVEALKQRRSNTKQSFFALDDWLLWIHVREVSIIIGILTLWFGLIIYAFIQNSAADWKIAFFVGYSMDSLMEVFLQRFEKVASQQTQAIKKTLEAARLPTGKLTP